MARLPTNAILTVFGVISVIATLMCYFGLFRRTYQAANLVPQVHERPKKQNHFLKLLQRRTTMEPAIEDVLNTLSEAERAGGRVLHELIPLARSAELRELLKKVSHDEGYYAGELTAHVRRLGGQPSNKTGDFVDKVRAVPIFKDKLELLNRGQRWVMRKIEETLPSIADAELHGFLAVMKDGHRTNIRALEETLQNGAA
jgi:hypothetical protein